MENDPTQMEAAGMSDEIDEMVAALGADTAKALMILVKDGIAPKEAIEKVIECVNAGKDPVSAASIYVTLRRAPKGAAAYTAMVEGKSSEEVVQALGISPAASAGFDILTDDGMDGYKAAELVMAAESIGKDPEAFARKVVRLRKVVNGK